LKLLGLTFNFGGIQLQETETELEPCPENLKLALAGHVVLGIVMVTCTGCPGESVPLDGLKLMPLPLADADQCRLGSPGLLELRDKVSLQLQPLSNVQSVFAFKLFLLTTNIGGEHDQGTVTVLACCPLKLKLALAGQVALGIVIVMGID